MEPEGSLPHSQQPATCPYQRIGPGPRLCRLFHNIIIFYGEELLAPGPTPKLEDNPLSGVRHGLFNVFAATLHNWRLFLHPQPEDAPCRGDRDPPDTVKPLIISRIKENYRNRRRSLPLFLFKMTIKPARDFSNINLINFIKILRNYSEGHLHTEHSTGDNQSGFCL
jgi:hypothetical protein